MEADDWRSRLRATVRRPFAYLAPTWGLANVLKPENDRVRRAAVIRKLNTFYLRLSVVLLIVTVAATRNHLSALQPTGWRWWAILPQWLLMSRFFEILSAFHRDAIEKIARAKPSKSSLTWASRVGLATKSYIELVFDFGLIYALLPASMWTSDNVPHPAAVSDALWYSANVITTSGGGGYIPDGLPLKLLTLCEVFCGVVLLVVCFTIYTSRALGGDPNAPDRTDDPMPGSRRP